MLRGAQAAALTGALLALSAAPLVAAEFDATTGYRIDRYRTPVDRPLEGGATVTLDEVDRLLAERGAALIDVMPARAGYDPATGRWRLVDPHQYIPGSVWLPEVGRGVLEPRLAAYFSDALKRLRAENPKRPLVFYCMADCWMSWNAVKRAASLGLRDLYWFPEGSDGWRDADRALVPGDPWPVPPLPEALAGHRRDGANP